ncbi:MAG: PAS domain S-box protein [Dehalogenimonas sp.]|uniref:PAS domain S-box protein n=1 Tax=Candidatus Dehalogenimonas loeffleri TaxID=3127115 RepID=A0ABZ2J4P9_9CHLR|nr:PAS domain S-box protein [Dehalogenimonas sp.]
MVVARRPEFQRNESATTGGEVNTPINFSDAAQALKITNRFLEIANRHSTMQPLLDEFAAEIKAICSCEAIGIRVLDNKGNIPYQSCTGFSPEFYREESDISIHTETCVCPDVITGLRKPHLLPYYTGNGSFCMGSIARHRANNTQSVITKPGRGACRRSGYDTLVLVPIRQGDRVLGLFHLADPKPDMVPAEMVSLLEKVGLQLGTALVRVQIEEELQKYRCRLEDMVLQRTSELQRLNDKLTAESAERQRLTESLHQSEDKYRSLFNAASDAIFVHFPTSDNHAGKFAEVNEAACTMLGYTHEGIRQLRPSDIIDADKAPMTPEQAIIKLRKSGKQLLESAFITNNGNSLPVEINQHLFEFQGIPAVLTIARDITERKNLEAAMQESREKLRLMLNQMPCILWAMDTDLRYTSASGLGLKLTGRKPEDLVGKTIFEYSSSFSENSPLVKAFRKTIKGKSNVCEQTSMLNDRTMLVHMEPMYDTQNTICGIVGVSVDITETKRTETRLKTQEEKINQLIKAYIHAQDEEREWLSLEVHDRVIQPMSAVFQQLQGVLPAAEECSGVSHGLNRAIELTDEVIRETRAVMKELYPSTLGRYGLPKIISEELKHMKADIGCRVKFDLDSGYITVPLMEKTLYRLFHESLLNIRKYAAASHVSVALKQSDDYVTLRIADNGVGFEPENMPDKPGGLASMRRRTELLGGTFEIKSRPGMGTIIISHLPCNKQVLETT